MEECHNFKQYEITQRQAERLTKQSQAIFRGLNDFLMSTPHCSVDFSELVDSTNATVCGFISSIDKHRRDRMYLSILAGGVLIALRSVEVPVVIEEIAKIVRNRTGNQNIDKSLIGKWKRKLDSHRNTLSLPLDPVTYVRRYASEIGIESEARSIALNIAEQIDSDASNRQPNVTAARLLWIGAKETNSQVNQKDIVSVAKTTSPSIRKDINEFSELMAAN
jgi:transcription initiation factor TFIIIB Brf1 subunit/transcription initiation factor TFIIB